MEALLILFAPLIEIMLVPVVAIGGAVFSFALELVAGLVAAFAGTPRRKRAKRQDGPADDARARVRSGRRYLHWGAGALLVTGLAGVAASLLFFDQILRFGLDRAEAKSGVVITYERARGNLLQGRVVLSGLHMHRAGDWGLAFDVRAEQVALDVVLTSLLGEPVIETARVIGARGFVTPPARGDRPPDAARRAFRVGSISIERVALDIRPRTGAAYPLAIERAEMVPFHSRTALFDLLFRSNLEAEIAGQHLSVETARITEYGRETHWRFENADAASLATLVPRAPLTWLEAGTLSARVDDRWSLSQDWIEMDWDLTLQGIEVTAPHGAGLREKALVAGFARFMAAKGGNAEFHYTLSLDQNDIATARAGDLAGFWDIIAGQLVKSATTPEAEDGARQTGGRLSGAIEAVQGALERAGK